MSVVKPYTFKNFKGIYSKGETPPSLGTYFTTAANVDITRNDSLVTRPGYAKKVSGDIHSMYPTPFGIICVKNESLTYVYPEQNYSEVVLYPSVGSEPWVYETIGDRIYASNTVSIGYIEGANWHNLPEVTQTYKAQLVGGHILAYYKGRLYVARNRFVFISDPAAYHMIDIRDDSSFFQRSSRITMLIGVTNGIWMSDEKNIYFLKGDSPGSFEMIKKAEYPAIEGTASRMPFIMLQQRFPYYDPVLFTTSQGICMGTEDGFLLNFTDHSFSMPSATKGSSIVKRGNINQYISIIK